jgi:hypothetical protein
MIGAAEQTNSVQKSKRRKDEEEEVEDRAEFQRMIGVCLQTTIVFIKLTMYLTV